MLEARAALAIVVVWAALGAAGCARKVLDNGVFRGRQYQVVPPPGWRIQPDGRAELSLVHGDGVGAMSINATCDSHELTRSLTVLMRHLLFGLREPHITERASVTVGDRPAERAVFEGVTDDGQVRGEAYVVRGSACLYDFLYVAPPDAFETRRRDFHAFVHSLKSP